MSTVTLRDMLEAGVHFGHKTRYWNPKMAPYIFGTRHDIHIINLDQTLPFYNDAVNCISHIAASRGKILFVGTKYAAQSIIREQAERCGMPFVNRRWLGGMLTNYKTIRLSIKRLKELETMQTTGGFENLTKKEGLNLTRELAKLEMSLGGIKDMGGLPDAIFVIDTGQENIAISEAKRLRIPVIGVVDTNNDPDNIDYIIPGNDDSERSILLYSQGMADAIIEARAHFVEQEKIQKQKEAAESAEKQKPVKKKVVTKKTAAKEKVTEKAEEKVEKAVETPQKPAAEKPVATKKEEGAKKATTKTAEKVKTTAKPKATTTAQEEKIEKSAVKKTTTEKPVPKKAVAEKKTVAKKVAAKAKKETTAKKEVAVEKEEKAGTK